MYVYIYIYMYVNTHTHTYAYARTRPHVFISQTFSEILFTSFFARSVNLRATANNV